ncbi:MAG: hypothetical protein ACOZQL_19360, partial [Myxococcota bacterium]
AESLRVEAWGGSRSVGAGLVRPDGPGARGALSAEALYVFTDRTVELRGARVWQLTPTQGATASVTLGAAAHVVPAPFDVGLGPHAGLNLSLGGPTFTVDLSLQSGAEFFYARLAPRLPQRAGLGLQLRLGRWALGVQARMGVDVLPGEGWVGRGEVVASLAWFDVR